MISDEVRNIEMARNAIETALAERALGRNPVPYFAPTDLGSMSPTMQEAELRVRDDTMRFNRTRASIYMCLTAAHAALEVALSLMDHGPALPHRDNARRLIMLAEHAELASEAAHHANQVLLGREQPASDESFEVKRGRIEDHHRADLDRA